MEVIPHVIRQIKDHGALAKWKYLECRAAEILFPSEPASQTYFTHDLSLARSDRDLMSGFRPSVRRNIKKAERSGLAVRIDGSLPSVKRFYRLNCLTRRRLGYPSQPFSFFRRIHHYVLSPGYGTVVSVFLTNSCIASAIYFYFGRQAIFKFGASDMRHQDLRPNNLVMWEAMKWLRDKGIQTMSFGRTNLLDRGLLRYKRGWGTVERQIGYHRYNLRKNVFMPGAKAVSLHKGIFRKTPVPLLRLVGHLAYKHLG
jgi:lipid II:glycine glycyltransferase (peptidoglycan interpeptide bridge formation enzyme)